MKLRLTLAPLTFACLALSGAPLLVDAAPSHDEPVRATRIDPSLRLTFDFMSSFGAMPPLYARSEHWVRTKTLPVVARFSAAPSVALRERLAGAGATFRARGEATFKGAYLLRITSEALDVLEKEPTLTHLETDLKRAYKPPMFKAQTETRAAELRRALYAKDGTLLDGHGVKIVDIDSGIAPLMPALRNADAGAFAWVDVDKDGMLTPGVDGVDLDGDGAISARETLRLYEVSTSSRLDGDVTSETGKRTVYETDLDYLYLDADGNGVFDFVKLDAPNDDVDALSEPIFLADDLDHNGKLGVSERLLRLGSSKISKVIHRVDDVYERGTELGMAAYMGRVINEKLYSLHGSGVAYEILAGMPGRSRSLGIAPAATFVHADSSGGGSSQDGEVELLAAVRNEHPDVILTEYAPYNGYPLDGSSEAEQAYDVMHDEDGVITTKPAGNLGTGTRHIRPTFKAGTNTVDITTAPGAAPSYLMVSLLYPANAAPSAKISFHVGGDVVDVTDGASSGAGGWRFYRQTQVSTRGTRWTNFYGFKSGSGPGGIEPLPSQDFQVVAEFANGVAPFEADLYTADDANPWDGGIVFANHHEPAGTICHPSTSDKGLRIAAYGMHDEGSHEEGKLAEYSSRGPLLHGAGTISIAGPANPIVTIYYPGGLDSTTDGANIYHYAFGGTSGASPMVTGSAALLRQLYPTENADAIEKRLTSSARKDGEVTDVNAWGAGKLDVFKAAGLSESPEGTAPVVTLATKGPAYAGREVPLVATVVDDDVEPRARWDFDYDGTWDTGWLSGADALSQKVKVDATLDSNVRVEVLDKQGNVAGTSLRIAPVNAPFPDPTQASADGNVGGGGIECSAANLQRKSPLHALWITLCVSYFALRARARRNAE